MSSRFFLDSSTGSRCTIIHQKKGSIRSKLKTLCSLDFFGAHFFKENSALFDECDDGPWQDFPVQSFSLRGAGEAARDFLSATTGS